MRVHVLGGSASGTTTLGRALAHALRVPHFDTDAYYWEPTEPPFERKRPVERRHALLLPDLRAPSWVLSGSLCSWSEPVVPLFDLVVYLWVPAEVRMARLKRREQERYGAAIEPGGPLRGKYEAFVAWAEGYDDAGFTSRSRARHDAWLRDLPCPVLRLEGEMEVEAQVRRVLDHVGRT